MKTSHYVSHQEKIFTRRLLSVAITLAMSSGASLAFAQTTAATAAPQTSATPTAPAIAQKLEPVVVTGNPFGNSDAGQARSVLTGEELQQRQSATLGETLSGLSGISSTYFGPNASRPIIRGQDSERVRVLENGASSHDAASLSFDHAVPIEPIAIERIEVLRGPAALLYGGSAVGGVVNAISNRIPRQTVGEPSFSVAAQVGGAERTTMGAARMDTGSGALSFHLDATHRDNDDLRVPSFTRPDGKVANLVVNSALKSNSAAVGASVVGHDGYVGMSVDGYRGKYGVVVDDEVTIDMKRDKFTLEGQQRFHESWLHEVSGHVTSTRYQHQEIEGSGAVGTIFKNRGEEWRIEAKTANYGPWCAVIGLYGDTTKFSAIGTEAFVPPNKTTNVALFAMQQATLGATDVAFGTRVERSRVSTSEVLTDSGELRFGAADAKHLNLGSASIGITQRLSPTLTISGNLAYSERAPSYFERYADGVHVATGAYERGDRNLSKEKTTNVDIGIAWQHGKHRAQLTAFTSRHRNFISLDATGENFTEVNEAGKWRRYRSTHFAQYRRGFMALRQRARGA
jgi:iron complex outermembrane recepter protein